MDLLNAARSTRYEPLLWIDVTTGLRQGEILGLKWSDLDWVSRRLSIQRQVQRLRGRGVVFAPPKSQAGRRSVLLGVGSTKRLRGHHAVQSYERQFAGSRWQENDLIFASPRGTPMEPRNLLRGFKELLRRAGLPDIGFHGLRHTAATLMLQQGIHPKVVQERLGHSDIALTLNTYAHVLPSIQEEAVHKLDQLFAGKEAEPRTGSMPKARNDGDARGGVNFQLAGCYRVATENGASRMPEAPFGPLLGPSEARISLSR